MLLLGGARVMFGFRWWSRGSRGVMEVWRFGFTMVLPAFRGYDRAASVWLLLVILELQVWIDVEEVQVMFILFCVWRCESTALSLALFVFTFAFITRLLAVSPYSGSFLGRVKVKVWLVVSPYSVSTLCRVKVKVCWVWCSFALWVVACVLWSNLGSFGYSIWPAWVCRLGVSAVAVLLWGWRQKGGGATARPCWCGSWRGLGLRNGRSRWSTLSILQSFFNVCFVLVGSFFILISLVDPSGSVQVPSVDHALSFYFVLISEFCTGCGILWGVSVKVRWRAIIKWLLPPSVKMKRKTINFHWDTSLWVFGLLQSEKVKLLNIVLCLYRGLFSQIYCSDFKTDRVAGCALSVNRQKSDYMYCIEISAISVESSLYASYVLGFRFYVPPLYLYVSLLMV